MTGPEPAEDDVVHRRRAVRRQALSVATATGLYGVPRPRLGEIARAPALPMPKV